MIALILPWPVYLICRYLVLQHLSPASPPMIRLGGLFGEVLACVCHVG